MPFVMSQAPGIQVLLAGWRHPAMDLPVAKSEGSFPRTLSISAQFVWVSVLELQVNKSIWFSLSIPNFSGFGDQGFLFQITFGRSCFSTLSGRAQGYGQGKVGFSKIPPRCPNKFCVLRILGPLKINKPQRGPAAVHNVHRKFLFHCLPGYGSFGDYNGVRAALFGFICLL